MIYDLAIVGSGPAGLAAAAHARANGLSYVLLERAAHLSDTIYNYQARKFVMAEPVMIPGRSELPFLAGSRESILDSWARYVDAQSLNVVYGADVRSIQRTNGGFTLVTAGGASFNAGKVIVAVGTQGNPRKLGCPGE